MQVQTRGEFGGLGIEVTMENGLVKVVSPIDDTPASKAGVQPGDFVTHIDGEAVMGMSLSEAVEKMRGPVDSKIDLRLLRKGTDEPFDVSLNRAVIKISPVRARVEGDVAYVRLTTFNEQTAHRDAREAGRDDRQDRRQAHRHRPRPAQQSRRPARPGGGGGRRLSSTRARSSPPAAGGRTRCSASIRGRATSPRTCRWWC